MSKPNVADIFVGRKFWKWEVISEPFSHRIGKKTYTCVVARCECGKERIQPAQILRKGQSKGCHSCSGALINLIHGMSRHPLYRIFRQIRSRCYMPNNTSYHNYGGRGITICEEWLNDFNAFIKWAEDHGWRKGLDIDRRENDGPYSPDNCRIVPRKTNLRNTRRNRSITIDGVKRCLSEWCEIQSLNYQTVCGRLRRGWNPKRALGMES